MTRVLFNDDYDVTTYSFTSADAPANEDWYAGTVSGTRAKPITHYTPTTSSTTHRLQLHRQPLPAMWPLRHPLHHYTLTAPLTGYHSCFL
jgi:hypothetical protein